MSQGLRLLLPDREQLRWDTIDLDSQLPPEHRLVWSGRLSRRWILPRFTLASKPVTICRDALRQNLRCCWHCGCMPRWTASARRAPSNGCANTTPHIADSPAGFRPITTCSRRSGATAGR